MEPANDENEPPDEDNPELLMKAEARIAGRSVRQWRRLLKMSLGTWLGPHWSTALIICVVLYWIWTTYNR